MVIIMRATMTSSAVGTKFLRVDMSRIKDQGGIIGLRHKLEANYIVHSWLKKKTKRFNLNGGVDVHDVSAVLNLRRRWRCGTS
jgi:hypothetical protein